MRFAFKTAPQNTTWDDMLAVWREADDIELFESGWTFDHFYPIFSDPTGPCLEGWITLTALAQATRRLRLGTLVTGNGVEVFKQKRDVLAGHCSDVGRDVASIMTSVHLRVPEGGDLGPLVDEAAAYAGAGLDLGIVYFPPPHTPAALAPVAEALRPLAG
jgi:hypothetical protein